MAQEWYRVKDKRTGHEYSVTHVDGRHHEVLKKDAVSKNGRPLPAKHKKELSSAKAEEEESSTATTSTNKASSGGTAEKKEGSK